MMMYGSETSPSFCGCSGSPGLLNSVANSLLKIISINPLFIFWLILPCLCNAWSVTSRMCGYSPEWKGGAFQSLPRTFDWDETESYPASCHKVGSAGGGSMRLLSNFQNSYKKVRFSDMCPSPLTSKSFFIWLSMCFGSTCFWTLKGPCFKRFSFRI